MGKKALPFLSNNEPILSWLSTVLPDFERLYPDRYHMFVWHSVFHRRRSSDNLEGMCSEHHGPGRKTRYLFSNLQSHADAVLYLAALGIAPYFTEVRWNFRFIYFPQRKRIGVALKLRTCVNWCGVSTPVAQCNWKWDVGLKAANAKERDTD